MKNYTNSMAFALMLMASVVLIPGVTKAETNNGDDDVAPVVAAVVITSATTNGGDDVQVSKTTNGSDDKVISATTNGSDDKVVSATTNGSDDKVISATTNGGDDVGFVAPTVTPAPVITTTGGGSNNTGPVANTSSGRGHASSQVAPVFPIVSVSGCSYLTTYMNIDSQNDSTEVIKLQTFLKNNEKLNVDINGTFDQKTLDAVNAFQTKYFADIMAPWGASIPSGRVFYTTQKKVNEIVCKASLNLTAEQLSAIDAYKNRPAVDTTIVGNATGTPAVSPVIGSNDNGQTASASGTSIAAKIWGFIKWLFGYDK